MSDSKIQDPPNPLDETISWCRLNRPDCVEYLERIHRAKSNRSIGDTQALLFLVSLGFAAGREFQASPAHAGVLRLGKSPYGSLGVSDNSDELVAARAVIAAARRLVTVEVGDPETERALAAYDKVLGDGA